MVDLILVIMILIFAWAGYYKGLIKALITLTSSVVALALSLIIYPMINQILRLTALYTNIYNGVYDKVRGIDFGKGLQTQGNAITENITWIPKPLIEQIVRDNNQSVYEMLGVSTLMDYISTYITDIIIALISIVITWFIIKVVLVWVLRVIGGIVEHMPVISGMNRLGGFVVGGIKGILTLCIITLLVPVFITIPSLNELGKTLQSAFLVQWFYEHNWVIWLYNQFILGK